MFPTLSSFLPSVLARRKADRDYAQANGLPAPSGLVDSALEYASAAVNASAAKDAAEDAFYRARANLGMNPNDPMAQAEYTRAGEAYRNASKYDVAANVGSIFKNFRSGSLS